MSYRKIIYHLVNTLESNNSNYKSKCKEIVIPGSKLGVFNNSQIINLYIQTRKNQITYLSKYINKKTHKKKSLFFYVLAGIVQIYIKSKVSLQNRNLNNLKYKLIK